jgi:hypothetical protein
LGTDCVLTLAFQYKHQAGCELRDDWQWGFVVVHIYLHSRGMSTATSPMKFRAPRPLRRPSRPKEYRDFHQQKDE